jgi:hypothetical protein
MSDCEIIFKRDFLFSKDDLLVSLSIWIEHEEENEDHEYSDVVVKNRIGLAKQLIAVIEKCHLPLLDEMWQYYDYTYWGDRMVLELCEASDFEIDEDECPTMSVNVIGELLRAECELLTIDQFADMHNTKPATVESWINRGKLRHAKQTADGWRIPNTEDKPKRSFESVSYDVKPSEKISSNEFPMLAMAEHISIKQSDSDKKKYTCTIRNFSKKFANHFELSKDDAERLEFILISSENVQIESPVQFVPLIDRDVL